jgi:hypothetical protein
MSVAFSPFWMMVAWAGGDAQKSTASAITNVAAHFPGENVAALEILRNNDAVMLAVHAVAGETGVIRLAGLLAGGRRYRRPLQWDRLALASGDRLALASGRRTQ